jgi:hypothetical protein
VSTAVLWSPSTPKNSLLLPLPALLKMFPEARHVLCLVCCYQVHYKFGNPALDVGLRGRVGVEVGVGMEMWFRDTAARWGSGV